MQTCGQSVSLQGGTDPSWLGVQPEAKGWGGLELSSNFLPWPWLLTSIGTPMGGARLGEGRSLSQGKLMALYGVKGPPVRMEMGVSAALRRGSTCVWGPWSPCLSSDLLGGTPMDSQN